jgi:voltage-gated potassium channel Kch/K+/H+ antiporter YhaU regulatory subunit KhtT
MRERLRYRFDNVLARGTTAALAWLGLVTLGAVLFSAVLLTLFGVTFTGTGDSGLAEDTWQSLLRILDTGTMAGDVGWGRRILALMITLFGLLVAGTLIGIIAAGVEARIDSMRRGRSMVIESGHLVILGGSTRIPVIIGQLVLANAQRGPNTIVVLSPTDPTELRRAVIDAVPDQLGTRVVYRYGDPTTRSDLAIARTGEARGVVVLPASDGDDISVTRTVLALAAELGELHELPIVVEVADPTTAHRLVQACGPTMHPIATAEALARTGAFALRQRGLGKVTNELTDFRGCDLHLAARPELVGVRFDEIVGRFTNARPIGIARRDGRFELNPPGDTTVADDDRLIVIADDLERIEVADEPARLRKGDPVDIRTAEVDEHLLVIGWNHLGPHLLSGWATAASPTSTVDVAFDPRLLQPGDIDIPPLGVTVELSPAPEVSSLTFERTPTTIVVLGYHSIDSDAADARTMLDVMYLQRRFATGGRAPRLVVQLLDDDHVDLAALPGPDDVLISAALGSQFIAQLIEQPERRDVLLALYGGDDASIRMVRCDRFDLVGNFTMQEIVARAYGAGVLAIGWRRTADGSVLLNPGVDRSVTLVADDELVVVG